MNRRRFVLSSVAAGVGLAMAGRTAFAAGTPIVESVRAVTGVARA